MNQKDRELILKDLTARLRYGVKILHEGWNYELDDELSTVERVVGIDDEFIYTKVIDTHNGEEYRDDKWPVDTFDDKLFLRPMSSMTEEEKKELSNIGPYLIDKNDNIIGVQCNSFIQTSECQDWLNEHYFDYRGLIPMGLALEAPEDMYNN